MKRHAAIAPAAVLLLAGAGAAAESVEILPKSSPIVAEIAPLLGSGGPLSSGWNGFFVRIQNTSTKPVRGQVQIESVQYIHRHVFRSSAPFSVGSGSAVSLRVPTYMSMYGESVVTVTGESGEVITTSRFNSSAQRSVFLLEVSEASRLRGSLHETPIFPGHTPWHGSGSSPGAALFVGSPRFDPATGDPILPDRAALYGSAAAVLMRSDTLSRLSGAELDALAGYVLAGGTLAVAMVRPEDLRAPTLQAMAGGEITAGSPPAATLREFYLPRSPSSSDKEIPPARSPTGEVGKALSGYYGGNLSGSLYGSSAFYGLGELHLLAFDPTRKPATDDPWVQVRLVDLVRRAFDRQSMLIFKQGGEADASGLGQIRQELDPNESSRWSIAAATVLLCIYAALAGPVNFSLAAKKGKPLRALWYLPALAAATFALIVAIGIAAKGITGRARHITLIEVGAGVEKGSARRYRGFFTSHAKDLTVRTTDGTSLVSTAVVAEPADPRSHLLIDRDGARLVDVAALPWQTVVVREDGFASAGEGISIVKETDSQIAVINRSGHDIRAALLHLPAGDVRYFARIKDGEKVLSTGGKDVLATAHGRAWAAQVSAASRSGPIDIDPLAADYLTQLLEPDAPGLARAWDAIEASAGENADWFPEDVPVLLAQLDGGEGRTGDSGLRLERDRLLVRVVGYGGRP